ncbi:MAG TPA: response regulator [Anaerolineae bacterium]|nr:response regulator [Anaerolineae bacterium]HRV91130.1 response regulator [Anaerolineae bacterium]
MIDLLYIDDNPNDAQLLFRTLEKQRITSKYFLLKDGEEALEFFFGQLNDNNPLPMPKIVLLDIKLPKVTGFEVLQKLKSDHTTKKIPVIIFTSSNERQDLELAYQLGANSYLVKPDKYQKLKELVQYLGKYWLDLNEI